MHSRAALAFVAIASLLACSDRGGRPNARGGGPGVTRNGLTDNEVAAALAEIHASEIEQAQLALDRARDPAVRAYADSVAKQFTHIGHEENETLARIRLAPRDSALSRGIQGQSIDTLRSLYRHRGPDFDRAFLSSQRQTTDHALSVVDGLLIPNAQNPALRNELEQTRALLLRHLNETNGMLGAMQPPSAPAPSSQIPLRGP